MQKHQGLPGSLRASKSPTVDPVVREVPAPVRSPGVPRNVEVPGAPTENPRTSRISSFGVSFRSALVVALIVPIIYPFPDVTRHVHSAVGALVGIVAPVNGMGLATAVFAPDDLRCVP